MFLEYEGAAFEFNGWRYENPGEETPEELDQCFPFAKLIIIAPGKGTVTGNGGTILACSFYTVQKDSNI
jgi:hypothetical protein